MKCRVCMKADSEITGVDDEKIIMNCPDCGQYLIEEPTRDEVIAAGELEAKASIKQFYDSLDMTRKRNEFFEENDEEPVNVLHMQLMIMTYEALTAKLVEEKKADADFEQVEELLQMHRSIFSEIVDTIQRQALTMCFVCAKQGLVPPAELLADIFNFEVEEEVSK